GSTFHYASGTTVLLCRIIREAIGGTLADYFAFPRQTLFERLGMASAILEPDAAGTFVGSSFMYATARDWAKLGLLYLQDGRWWIDGKWVRILPEGWAQFSSSAGKAADFYGAHFWRGVQDSFTIGKRDAVDWPADAYLASGYQGQFVTIVPSADLVVVRLGLSHQKHSWDHARFISSIVFNS
ncbi:MAG: serine hydrolase, partial [Cyanobacteria bacterium J06631_12]